MKQRVMTVLMTAILLAALAGCGQQEELRETQRQLEQTQQQLEQLQQQLDQATAQQPAGTEAQTTQQPAGNEQQAAQTTQQPAGNEQQAAQATQQPAGSEQQAAQATQQPAGSEQQPAQQTSSQPQAQGGVDRDGALAIALENAGVSEGDIYNVKVEQDGDNGIPIYDIEFETDYGDYDFEVAVADGRIVGADYEVDEEWLDTLGGSPVDQDGVRQLVAAKVPGASAQDVQVREEGGDGRGRYEGELYHDSMKYEFEVDPRTGRIFDWAADWRG